MPGDETELSSMAQTDKFKAESMTPSTGLAPWDKLPVELTLDIINQLSEADFSRLSRVSRLSRALFQPLLYQRDVREGGSFAILWAAKNCAKRPDTCSRTLNLSIENGGNVNKIYEDGDIGSTALHIAAALGKASFVRLLIQRGASVHICARNPALLKDNGKSLPRLLRLVILKQTKWYPLLAPFLRNHREVIRALQEAGAPAELALRLQDPQIPGKTPTFAVTIHHLLAIYNKPAMSKDYNNNCLFQRYRRCIDTKIPGVGSTALQLSVVLPQCFAFDRLLEAGASIDMANANGQTPLYVAACLCDLFSIGDEAPWSYKCISTLLDLGANPNASVRGTEDTPLLALTENPVYSKYAGLSAALHWKSIIDLLIQHGANINHINQKGNSALHHIFNSLVADHSNGTCMSVFQKLLSSGGNVNIPLHPLFESLLKRIIINHNMVPLSLFRVIRDAGAELFPHEVDEIFHYWLHSKKLRDAGFDMMKYKTIVSVKAISEAYTKYFCSDPDKFQLVCDRFPVPNPNERMVAALLKGQLRIISKVTKIPSSFDPNWIDEDGDSFLHMVVNKALKCMRPRSAKICAGNAKFLIDKGASTSHRNSMAQTVFERLPGNRRFKPIIKCFIEQQLRENEQMADGT